MNLASNCRFTNEETFGLEKSSNKIYRIADDKVVYQTFVYTPVGKWTQQPSCIYRIDRYGFLCGRPIGRIARLAHPSLYVRLFRTGS